MALARAVGGSVQAPQSQTSLQLSLENPRVNTALWRYLETLTPAPEGKRDTIGVAILVNGQLQGAEVYGSSALFRDMWPRLLKANAIAALAEQVGAAGRLAPSAEAVRTSLTVAEAGASCQQERTASTLVLRQESDQHLLFDTCDPTRGNIVVHRSFLTK
jgi:hypothetical protein